MEKKYILTQGKVDALKEELSQLMLKRSQNIIEISDARSQGDLGENADYSAAREEQVAIHNRINEINAILNNYELIQTVESNDKVSVGKWVKVLFEGLEDDEDDPVQVYRIVGTQEADPLERLISNESTFGEALLNHAVGDTVYIKPAEGEEFYVTIIDISSEEIA